MWELADKGIKSVTSTIFHMLQKLSRDMEDKRKDPNQISRGGNYTRFFSDGELLLFLVTSNSATYW